MRSFARYLLRSNRFELYAIVKVCRCVYVCVCVLICLHIIPTECLVLVAYYAAILLVLSFLSIFHFHSIMLACFKMIHATHSRNTQYLHSMFGVAMYLCQKHKTYIKNYCFLLSELSCGDNFVSHFASENLPCSYVAMFIAIVLHSKLFCGKYIENNNVHIV